MPTRRRTSAMPRRIPILALARPAGSGCWPLPIPRRKTSTKLFVTMVAAYILHRPPASAVARAIATPLQFTSAKVSRAVWDVDPPRLPL